LARNIVLAVVVGIAALVGAFYGIRHWQFVRVHEETDDAQVEGHISPVLPRVPGYVASVLVKDNDHVTAGQALLEIDPREFDLKVAEADAAVKSAEAASETSVAALANARADAAVAQANVATAEVTAAKAAADLARDERLFKTSAITDSQLADTRAAADLAKTRLEAVRRQSAAAEAQVAQAAAGVAAARAQIDQRKDDLDDARLQRSYATVAAPISGLVSHKSVEQGQFVQAGQTLLSITSDSDVWVVANYKETQLSLMRKGLPAQFTADTYPGVVFRGTVDSIAGATGARFALLPPDNASGNYVKVTQRVPVKIVLAGPPDPDHPLRPGMSVDAAVRVKAP
jgi:membrane fusion protein (multidrug efflux system)